MRPQSKGISKTSKEEEMQDPGWIIDIEIPDRDRKVNMSKAEMEEVEIEPIADKVDDIVIKDNIYFQEG